MAKENIGKYHIYSNDETGLLAAKDDRELALHEAPQNLLSSKSPMLLGDMNALVQDVRKTVKTRPLVYFWIVEFGDKVAIAQFDPKTGNENSFGEQVIPRASKIKTAGWYPFSQSLMDKVGFPVIVLPVPIHRVDIPPGRELVIFRRNRIHYGVGSARGKSEYFLGVRGEPVKCISENGTFEMSIDYMGYS